MLNLIDMADMNKKYFITIISFTQGSKFEIIYQSRFKTNEQQLLASNFLHDP